MVKKHNTVPFDFFDDPKKIWQAQISGEKNFDEYSFMGALNDLQGEPDWRDVFDPVKDDVGMLAFLDRLQGHFDLCQSLVSEDGRQLIYMHPSRTQSENGPDKTKMIELAQRHMKTMVKAFEANGQPESADNLRGINVKWAGPENFNDLTWDEQTALWQGEPLGIYLSDAWDFTWYLDGTPEIRGCLYEAVYSLANDFPLTRYLMQSFMDHGLDVDAEYELAWIYKGTYYFDKTTCYVTRAQRS